MPQWIRDLFAGWPMIRANLPTFLFVVVLIFGAIWWLMDWRYGGIITGRDGIIANKDSEIALLKGQRDDYKDKLSGATPDQAKARIDTLEKIVSRLQPRRLSSDQAIELVRTLSQISSKGIQITNDLSCPDCSAFTNDLRSAFNRGGWKVIPMTVMGPNPTRVSAKGLALIVGNPQSLNHDEGALVEVFKKIAIPFDIATVPLVAPPPQAQLPRYEMELLITLPTE
jgi:hypothetical protein